jgi:hypothetical protein
MSLYMKLKLRALKNSLHSVAENVIFTGRRILHPVSLDSVLLNGGMISWMGFRSLSELLFFHFPGRAEENNDKHQDSQCSGWYSNLETSEYDSGAFSLRHLILIPKVDVFCEVCVYESIYLCL